MTTTHDAVTVIGLGAMGSALARAFLAAGHPTTVWNRSPGPAEALAQEGAVAAGSLAEAVSASPLVVVCVLDDAVVLRLLATLGDDLAGRALVNLTSSTPEQAREVAGVATALGADYLDGAIMVPTPLVGTSDGLVLYSGPADVFARHQATLRALGPDADHLGEDHGLASLYDEGMLDVFFAGMTAFLHAAAIVSADGVPAEAFLPYARRVAAVLDATLPGLARDVDAGRYPGDEDNLVMNLSAVDHIVASSRAGGVDPSLPELVADLLRRAIDDGHGRDGFSRVVEQLRRAPVPAAGG